MDKHGIAALLIGKPVGKEAPAEEKPEGGNLKAHLESAASKFLEAIKNDDPAALAKVFQTMHSVDHAIMDKEESGESPEEEVAEPEEAEEEEAAE